MKVLTSGTVFKGVARRVAVNMAWIAVFIVPAYMIGAGQPPWSLAMMLVLVFLAVLYAFVLWGTVAFAKWLMPKMQVAEAFVAATDDQKAARIVSCSWWG